MSVLAGTRNFLAFIRFSHTVFALPFALGAMFVAAGGFPAPRVAAGILAAMVFARTAAMTFNRLADWEIDRRNPRTAGRQTLASRPATALVCAACSAGFVAAAAWLNPLCFVLSPVALAAIFFYSLTKRFTHLAQFFLGLALSIAPVGAWLAVTGAFAPPPIILAGAVLLWVAGFDMIYALQDYEVDKREGLKSMVVWLGPARTRPVALGLHAAALGGFAAFGIAAALGPLYFAGIAAMAAILVWEHRLAARSDTESINRAFFHANAAVGAVFLASTFPF